MLEARDGGGVDVEGVVELLEHLLACNLGVVHGKVGAFIEKVSADVGRGGFTGVSSVLLESKAKDGNLLAGDGVEHALDNLVGESPLLVLIHQHDLVPIVGNLGEAERLANVHEVENILLEARSSVSHRCLEELGSDTRIRANGTGDFIDISIGGLAESGDGVDG